MLVDSTTLSDLEIFQDATGQGGLLSLLDETETDVGHKALRDRLGHPHSDAPSIVETQKAVAFFSAHPDVVPVPNASIKDVQHYLDFNVVLSRPGAGALETIRARWFALRNAEAYRDLKEGVISTLRLSRAAMGAARALLGLDPPSEVRRLADDLASACEAAVRPEGRRTPEDVRRLDRFFRGPGRASLERMIASIGELDALRSMARATERQGWSVPEIVDSEEFLFEGEELAHPFVEDAVPNPIGLTGGEPMVFLTGPNMAGKTTYLRSAAVVLLLAQVGMGVPARNVRLTPVEVLLTSLNPADNLRQGLSFFLAEVLRVREAAAQLAEGRRCFVVFDEVFKGTNVKDALDASETVILGFAKATGSGFIFSSHLVELAESLRSDARIRFQYFDGSLVSGKAAYSYRIQEGLSDQRFGLQLLSEARVPELIARIGV